MSPLQGFAPDADPTLPGVLTDCLNMVPTLRGVGAAPSGVAPSGVAALASECTGAAALMKLDGTVRLFAGTTTTLMELTGTTWTNRSKAGGYTGTTENRWSFAQFGDATIAANRADTLQASTAGAFADIAGGAPKAKVVVSTRNFVVAFNTSDGTFGDSPDRWWCSAANDHTTWTPSVSTQATTGRLVSSAGPIVTAIAFGQQVAVFKRRAMWLGTNAPSPVVWQWDQVPGDVGCIGQDAVCDVGGALFFLGEEDFYLFDGVRPVPVGTNQVREWFFKNSAPSYRHRAICAFDRQRLLVWVFFFANDVGTLPNEALVYHLTSRQWGRVRLTVEAALQFVAPGVTWDGLGALYSTWDDLPPIPYDSQLWLPGGRVFSVFDTSHQIVQLDGSPMPSSFTTGDFGEEDSVSWVNRVRLRFLSAPTTATAYGTVRDGLADTQRDAGSAGLADASSFALRQAGRYHRVRVEFTGGVEVTGLQFDARPQGTR